MTVLAIETTGAVKSIAYAQNQALQAETELTGDLLTQFWPQLENFLRENHLRLPHIDLFAACSGPGSWTGLRFGLAVVFGWSVATGKKVFTLTRPELEKIAPANQTLAATLAGAAKNGLEPEAVVVSYGYQPQFRKIEEKFNGKRKD